MPTPNILEEEKQDLGLPGGVRTNTVPTQKSLSGVRDHPASYTPYSRQYRRNIRNDLIRFIIYQALNSGNPRHRFEKPALHHLVNCYFEQEGVPETLSFNGFIQMLYRNCEGIWKIDVIDNTEVISRNGAWHYLKLSEHQKNRGASIINLCLNKLICSGEIMRNHGSPVFSWMGKR